MLGFHACHLLPLLIAAPRQRMVEFGRGGKKLEETGYRGDSGVSRMIMLPAYPCTPGRIGPRRNLLYFGVAYVTVVSSPDPPSGDEHKCRGKSDL